MSYLMLMTGTGKCKVLCKLKIYFVHFHTCQLTDIVQIFLACLQRYLLLLFLLLLLFCG